MKQAEHSTSISDSVIYITIAGSILSVDSMQRKWLITLLIFSVISTLYVDTQAFPAQATSGISIDDWPMFQHDPAHTGTTTTSAPISTPIVAWNITAPELRSIYQTFGSPIIANGVVYVAATTSLWALNVSTGDIIWKIQAYGSSYLVIDNCVLYASNYASAYNASTGTQLWNTTDSETGVLAVADGYFYSLNKEGFFVCRNASNGKEIWNSNISPSYVSPAISNGRLYLSSGHTLNSFNAHNGTILWVDSFEENVASSPTVSLNRVYLGCSDNNIYSLDALTGQKMWNYTTGGIVESTPAVANGHVYVGSLDGNIYCFNASTGEKIWNYTLYYSQHFRQGIHSSPAIADGILYVCSDDGNLYAFNALTGGRLWNYTLQSPFNENGNPQFLRSSPAFANNKIYIGSKDQMTAIENMPGILTPSASPSSSVNSGLMENILVALLSLTALIAVTGIIFMRRRTKNKTLPYF